MGHSYPGARALRGRLRPISVNAWCPLAFPTPQGPGGLRSSQLCWRKTGSAAIANTRSQLHGQLRGLTLPKLPMKKPIRRDLARFWGLSTRGAESGFSTGKHFFSGVDALFATHCIHEKSFHHHLLLPDLESDRRVRFTCRRHRRRPRLTRRCRLSSLNSLFTRENVGSAGLPLLAHGPPYGRSPQIRPTRPKMAGGTPRYRPAGQPRSNRFCRN